ncbi:MULTISPECIES: DUF503 domain-containing protein [Brevibacillus]|jgi:uncharacterized protein YlxP (DUF503 family)|uniref:DUF503 domain-containing protein n=1 Tax=Brevibacillus TaxID=55080 RepID=UPI000EC7984B|nr:MULTISPECIES: DUF503 domain-containing protein [Brevibacillus]MBU8711367.1 DUF503 family protein [Brevibacillus parabrevis]MDH6350005.1 uncharacterized protein YlxP (DUF503 family) [Brevibacillus sp. 1238]MDR4999457.1 DUF503 domain-containing protein [Brevibacillus parabrevis]MED1721676.1 DUF503 domain-containing protein [Brevibacillus parabrevis]MED2253982.1 DUF503 domain-containing protein [Brevibacillus parabrevis]
MIAGVQIELFLPACQNLKEKRAIVKSLIAKLRSRFNVSAAEVAYYEQWQRTVLGIAAVANEMSFLQQEMQAVVRFVENHPDAELIRVDTEYYE